MDAILAPMRNNSRRMISMVKLWLPVLLCMGLIFYCSTITGGTFKKIMPFQDVIFHFFAYMILCLFFSRAIRNNSLGMTAKKLILFTVLFALVYGATDEWHQVFVPNRTPSLMDLFIDGLGGFAGSLFHR